MQGLSEDSCWQLYETLLRIHSPASALFEEINERSQSVIPMRGTVYYIIKGSRC